MVYQEEGRGFGLNKLKMGGVCRDKSRGYSLHEFYLEVKYGGRAVLMEVF